jgi:surface antigen
MNFKALAARFALVVSCGLMTATPAAAQFWQCVTFARSVSGIEIRGNANTWWSQAEGRYERGHSRMRVGHVAMVSKVVSDREVLLTHANWSRRGAVETNVRAVDVSDAGDWSMVKVWYGPQGGLGTSAYPTKGFIYSGHAPAGDTLDAQPSYQMASATRTVTATQRANAAQLATIQHGPTDPRGIFTLVNEAN